MDALGLSQRCGNGGKGIGVKCIYGEYLHLKKRFLVVGGGRGGFSSFLHANSQEAFFCEFFFFFTQVAIRQFPIK